MRVLRYIALQMKRADTISLSLRADVIEWLRSEEDRRGVNVSAIVREILLPHVRGETAAQTVREPAPPLPLAPVARIGSTQPAGAPINAAPRYTITRSKH